MEMPADGRPSFYDPRGLPVPDAPPVIRLGVGAAEALVQQNRSRGIDPDFWTSAARYRRGEDIPWPVIVRAIDALEASVARGAGSTGNAGTL